MKIAPLIALTLGTAPALPSTPSLGGPMSHILVTLFNNQIDLTLESPDLSTVTMQEPAQPLNGPAAILNGTGYNAQFGWLANGFIALPPDAGIYVRTLVASPHLSVYDEITFETILGTSDSDEVWRWDGTMTHNWYSTAVHGPHLARYEVFVGDHHANPLGGYAPGTIELRFDHSPDLSGRIGLRTQSLSTGRAGIPTPGTLALASIALLTTSRRRR